MARIRIIACDSKHGDELRPAVGRVGIQEADARVAWRDTCEECLARAKTELLGNGSAPRPTLG